MTEENVPCKQLRIEAITSSAHIIHYSNQGSLSPWSSCFKLANSQEEAIARSHAQELNEVYEY
jgi:hypothetical protein